MQNILSLDLGGSSIKYGLYDIKGTAKSDSHVKEINRIFSLDKLIETIDSIYQQYENIDGIGMSLPGVVDKTTRVISIGGAIPCLDGVDLQKILHEKYNIPISVENDANCATLAEFWLGNGRGCTNLVCITIGTGIGGGTVINNKLYTGSHSFASEFGIMYNTPNNNAKVNFSQQAATSMLVEKANKIDSSITNGKEFFANIQRPEIKIVYDHWITDIARSIYNIAVVIDPDKVLLGGGISSQDMIYNDIKEAIDDLASYPYYWVVEPCKFRNDAGKIGAVYGLAML